LVSFCDLYLMGTQHSELGLYDLRDLWNYVPAGGEIVVTRDKITVSNSPTLEIKNRVLLDDLNPSDLVLNLNLSQVHYSNSEFENAISPKTSLSVPMSPEIKPVTLPATRSYSNRWESRRNTYGSIDEATHLTPKHSKVSSVVLLSPEQFLNQDDLYGGQSFGGFDTMENIQEVSLSEDRDDYLDRMPTTVFRTGSSRTLRTMYANDVDEEEDQGSWVDEKSESIADSNIDEHEEAKTPGASDLIYHPMPVTATPITTDKGIVLLKKLATQYEQKGQLECHVYFTPRTSAEIWPHLIVMVDENWQMIKVLRKALAEMQRTIKIGDREGTHDWIFDYHPNKNIKKIRKELKILFGPRALNFRDSNLKKMIKDSTSDFINKMWILQKSDYSGKQRRGRSRGATSRSKGSMKNRSSSQPTRPSRSISVDLPKGYPRRYHRSTSTRGKKVQ